jgi:iron complex transport system substrate-binding protein
VATAGALIASAAPTFAALFAARSGAQAKDARVVTDDVGRRVAMPAEVRRVVTLAPNLTETVYALGLEDRLAGDTDYCDTPAAAKLKPHVGNPQDPSLEAIVALHPDLVLATTSINRLQTADALKQLGISVYTSNPQTVRGMLDSTRRMAELMGAAQQGADLVGRLQQQLDALHARLEERPMVHVLFVVWEDPLITIGQNTFIADALRYAGAESVVLSDRNWPQLSLEEVFRLQPDYIVFAGNHGESAATELADLRTRPAWRGLDAVESGHVVNVDEEALRPSPGLVDAIEELAHALHPEAFAAKNEIRNRKNENRFASETGHDAGQECRQCAR